MTNIARTAYYSFVPLLILFLLYVGFGYYFSLSSAFPDTSDTLITLGAVSAAVLVYFALRHVAFKIDESRGRSGLGKLSWLVWFLLAFAVSGYGFLVSSMLLFEGPEVVREALDAESDAVAKLGAEAPGALRVLDWERVRSRVEDLRIHLHSEIHSPGHCGIGPGATGVLNDLHAILPEVVRLNGHGPVNCSESPTLGDLTITYDQMIDAGLKNHPLYVQYRIEDRYKTERTIELFTSNAEEDLKELRATVGSLRWFVFALGVYADSVKKLDKIQAEYRNKMTDLRALVGDRHLDIPDYANIGPIHDMGDPRHLVPLIIERLSHINTWIYLALAVGMDLLVAYCGSAVLLVLRRRREQREFGDGIGVMPASDVLYLWVPERLGNGPKNRRSKSARVQEGE